MTTFFTHKGYKPDLPDSRDKLFSLVRDKMVGLSGGFSDDYEIDDGSVPVYDQLDESSCVANAWTAGIRIIQSILQAPAGTRSVAVPDLSRQFLYWTARCLTSEQHADQGTYLRSGAKALATLGIPTEASWPYTPSKVLVSPGQEAFNIASDNMLAAYYSITNTGKARLDDIDTAIHASHPVEFGTNVGADLEAYYAAAADPNKVFDAPASVLGGHALLIVGRRTRTSTGKREYKIRNSWSAGWGLNGYVWFSEDYLMDSSSNDFWVGVTMPSLVV